MNFMKVLVVGAKGQLGTDICEIFHDCGVHKADIDGENHRIDITDADAVHRLIVDKIKPGLVVNTAAAHNVVECERSPNTAYAVNATGSHNLAKACKQANTRLMHVSTDYVFGHAGTQPYVETDLPAPLSVYAASKLAGEHLIAAACQDHIIVRTAAIYGKAECRAKSGLNFVRNMLQLAATRPEVKVVTDEITTPTYTVALAKQMRLLAEKANPGLYHTTCQGQCAWYEFADAIFTETNTKTTLLEATSKGFQSPVDRPNYSVLENKRAQDANLDIMPPWREALKDYLRAMEE